MLDADGNPLDEGVGRLAIKGPTGCRYLDDPRQRDYVADGWNVTGDTYRSDADGYYWYLARSDDMIVSSGYNIGAPEVENALLSHPAVAECAVIGVPCPERGQKVKAFVVLARGRGAVRRAGRGAAGARESARLRPTNIRARSSSWTRCRRRRQASSGGASCGARLMVSCTDVFQMRLVDEHVCAAAMLRPKHGTNSLFKIGGAFATAPSRQIIWLDTATAFA